MLIWSQYKRKLANPIAAAADMTIGHYQLDNLCAAWVKTKKGRKAVKDGLDRRLYYSDGKMAGMLWLDPFPDREPVTQPKPKGENA